MMICNLLITLPRYLNCAPEDSIVTLLKLFDQKKTTIIDTSKENQVTLFKRVFKNDIFCVTKKDFVSIEDEFVLHIFKENIFSEDFNKLSKSLRKGIIIFNNPTTFEMAARKLTFRIDQEVYLYDESLSELYEIYEINNVMMKNKLGVVKNVKQFIWSKDIIQK